MLRSCKTLWAFDEAHAEQRHRCLGNIQRSHCAYLQRNRTWYWKQIVMRTQEHEVQSAAEITRLSGIFAEL